VVKLTVRLSTVLFNQCSILLGKCVCQLQIVYAYLASGGFDPHPTEFCPWTPLGDFRSSYPMCPPDLQTPVRHCPKIPSSCAVVFCAICYVNRYTAGVVSGTHCT